MSKYTTAVRVIEPGGPIGTGEGGGRGRGGGGDVEPGSYHGQFDKFVCYCWL